MYTIDGMVLTSVVLPLVYVHKLKALAAIEGYNYQYSKEQNDIITRRKYMEVCWIRSVTAQGRHGVNPQPQQLDKSITCFNTFVSYEVCLVCR